ncbi:G-protein beta WD- 40 repeats containing protein [Penicillium angulare]|uniref:G-protein beta WD- 40 repeats containing protein n=1 Tax=Penicillium angulare TaxID=116970 RepID=A0A9W9FB76_9EURO|nr:G-protein beta WD- 40 repeats containing protein [Penicillium angulare]
MDFKSEITTAQSQQSSTTVAYTTEQIDDMCLRALRCPDTLVVKNRLKEGKDKLLRQSFAWVLETSEYRSWRDENTICLLWIKGGAGKGKTMMSIGLIEILSQENDSVVTYFFFQNGDNGLNTLESLMKGLILRLVTQRSELKESLRRRWDLSSESFKEDIDMASWRVLWDIFLEMLDKCAPSKAYIIIDALDECEDSHIAEFLQLVVRNGLDTPRIKWLFTSRHLDASERVTLVGYDQIQVSLETNSEFVSKSVQNYISYKVDELSSRNRYDKTLRDQLKESLSLKAEGTFLWVSLACKRLECIHQEEVLATIEDLPPGLHHFYDRIMRQLSTGELDDIEQQIRLLKAMILAYRPLKIEEISVITGLGDDTINILVNRCASFVRLQDNNVEFVHQSARDYLAGERGMSFLKSHTQFGHYEIVLSCLAHLSKRLWVNLIGFPLPSGPRFCFQSDKLSAVDYPASFWVQHLQKSHPRVRRSGFIDQGPVGKFLRKKLLEWLECLSILGRIDGVFELFEILMDIAKEDSSTLALLRDAVIFLVDHRNVIYHWPLQIYSVCLIFCPESNLVRRNNLAKLPRYYKKFPVIYNNWEFFVQTMRRHSRTVKAIAISSYGKQIASGSDDKTIKIWHMETGDLQKTLNGHLSSVNAVAFSSDGRHIASGSSDKSIKLWDSTTADLKRTLGCELDGVYSVAFSPDDRHVASGCLSGTITLWNVATGEPQKTRRSHPGTVNNIAFSPDANRIASSSFLTGIITIWNLANNNYFTRPLGSYLKHRPWKEIKIREQIRSLKFSADNQYIVTDSNQIRLEDGIQVECLISSNDFLSLSVAEQWIRYGDQPFFRLLLNMELACYDVQDDHVAIGLVDGRVFNFVFDRRRLHSKLKVG